MPRGFSSARTSISPFLYFCSLNSPKKAASFSVITEFIIYIVSKEDYYRILTKILYTTPMNKHLKFATLLANALDNTFSIGGIRFGFAALINVIPGIGDFIDVFLSLYLVWIARQLKVPQIRIAQMLWNILISFLI